MKRTIAEHEQDLAIFREMERKRKHSAEVEMLRWLRLKDQNDTYESQIELAKREGRDGFDSDRYGLNRRS